LFSLQVFMELELVITIVQTLTFKDSGAKTHNDGSIVTILYRHR